MKNFVIILLLYPFFTLAQKTEKVDVESYRQIIKEALTNKKSKQILVEKVIPDKETAIAVAEPILFKIYGKDKILGEKPYNVTLVDNYWILSGSLPLSDKDEDVVGGTFLNILSAKDGRVIELTHYK